MTGGVAYVLDLEDKFETLYNPQLIQVKRFATSEDEQIVMDLTYQHLEATDSARAREILGDWPRFQAKFWKVSPLPVAAITPAVSVQATANSPSPIVPPAAVEIMAAANP